jgi:hypothetical protein
VARRTLASAGLAASIGAVALCTLALQLNPGLTLRAEAKALLLSLFLPWVAGGTCALALLALVASALRWWPRPQRPVVDGCPFLTSLSFVALAVVAALYWHNLLSYRHAIPLASVGALAASALVVSGAALALVAVGLDVVLFPRHERPFAAVVAILAPAAAIAVPLALRPTPEPPERAPAIRLDAGRTVRRVIVIGVDGLSPSDLEGGPGAALVPWLARLARRGALAPLATVRPTEGPPVWTTLMTGRLPCDHGIRSAFSYRLLASSSDWALLPKGASVALLERARLVSRRPVPSTARRRRALWNVLDAFGIPSGLVGVWGTHPPETIRGFVVSPYFHVLRPDPERAAGALFPRDLAREVAARAVEPSEIDPLLLRELADPPSPAASPLTDPALRRLAADALAPDLTYERVADVLRSAYDPSFLVVNLHGFDAAGHAFYRFAHPEAFGDVDAEDARRYGRVLGGYAALVGRWVQTIEKSLRPGDVLVVVSGHGLEPTPLWRRLLGVLSGTEVAAASHAGAPPGVLLIVGDGVVPGATTASATVLDLAPTLLYLMGLPVPRDMDGRVLSELVDAQYASDNPLTFIPSYESVAVAPAAPGGAVEDLPPLPEDRP